MKPTNYYAYEVMDRTSCIQQQISNTLYEHPGLTAELQQKIDEVQSLLYDVYQGAANIFFDSVEEEND